MGLKGSQYSLLYFLNLKVNEFATKFKSSILLLTLQKGEIKASGMFIIVVLH